MSAPASPKPRANWIEWQGGKIVRRRSYADRPAEAAQATDKA
jgi:hypothetical protein